MRKKNRTAVLALLLAAGIAAAGCGTNPADEKQDGQTAAQIQVQKKGRQHRIRSQLQAQMQAAQIQVQKKGRQHRMRIQPQVQKQAARLRIRRLIQQRRQEIQPQAQIRETQV